MTLGSLFSGSGSFELAGVLSGIAPVFASEVEPYPIAVTTSRFPYMKHLGSVTDVHGDEADPVDVLTMGFPCFPAGTLILTDQGYKPIEDVKVGDLCLTHRNQWKRVVRTGHREAPTILLKGNHYGLRCTPEHPFYVGNEQWEQAKNMLDRKWAVPCEVAPLPIPQMRDIGSRYNTAPEINADLMYICGRWLADGWIRDGQRSNRPIGQTLHQIVICANEEKTPMLLEKMRLVFPYVAVTRERTCNKLRVQNAPMQEWLMENFGRGAAGKRLPAWIYGADIELRKAFLRGYFDGDGDCDKLRSTTVSKQLAHGIRLLGECT